MIRLFIATSLLFSFFISVGFAQDSTLNMSPPISEDQLQALRDQQISPHARVYAGAMKLGDYQTAITALHYLLIEEPQNRFYKDSLAGLYMQTGNLEACKIIAEEIKAEDPNDLFVLNLLANIYTQEGRIKESLGCFESLEKHTNAPYYTYQVAVQRFQLERFGECRESIEKLVALPPDPPMLIRIFTNQQEQTIPIQAAALNLRGNLELKLGKKDAARTDFEKALEIAPDFLLAKGNLEQMK